MRYEAIAAAAMALLLISGCAAKPEATPPVTLAPSPTQADSPTPAPSPAQTAIPSEAPEITDAPLDYNNKNIGAAQTLIQDFAKDFYRAYFWETERVSVDDARYLQVGVFSESEAEAARELLAGFDFILVTILDRGEPLPSEITGLGTKAEVWAEEAEVESIPDVVIARCRWLAEGSEGYYGMDTRIEALLDGVWCEPPLKSLKFIMGMAITLPYGEEESAWADSVVYAYDFPPGDYRILVPIAEAVRDDDGRLTAAAPEWYAAEFKITG